MAGSRGRRGRHSRSSRMGPISLRSNHGSSLRKDARALFAPLTPYAYTTLSVLGATEPDHIGSEGHLSPGSGTIRGLDKLSWAQASRLDHGNGQRGRYWRSSPVLSWI